MRGAKKIFHWISYLQYPLNLISLFYVFRPYYDIFVSKSYDTIFANFNIALIFMGLGISLSTLQDTTITQNNFSKRIWESRRKGKIFLIVLSLATLLFLLLGLFGYFFTRNKNLEELSLGLIVFGVGCIGLIKTAVEMYENHQKD